MATTVKRFFRRALFAVRVASAVHFLWSVGIGLLSGAIAGAAAMSVTQLVFAALAAAGVFIVFGASALARLAWRSPKVCIGDPQHSDITITRNQAPFGAGLLAVEAMSATGSVATITGDIISKPAVMILAPVWNEQAPTRHPAHLLTVHLSCWTDGGEPLTREVRAKVRAAPRNDPPVELPATNAAVLFDSVCKETGVENAYIYTDEGATEDLRITEREFVLRIVVRGEFREVVECYRVTHGGPGTKLCAVLVKRERRRPARAILRICLSALASVPRTLTRWRRSLSLKR